MSAKAHGYETISYFCSSEHCDVNHCIVKLNCLRSWGFAVVVVLFVCWQKGFSYRRKKTSSFISASVFAVQLFSTKVLSCILIVLIFV